LSTAKTSFKQALRSGVPQIGYRSQLCSPMVAEALAWCGFDYIYIDMEHAPNDLMSVVQQSQAIGGTPAYPVVRLPTNDSVLIQQMLDAGVDNIVVPMVETPEEAASAAAATRYPPKGIRSAARVHRGSRYGAIADYDTTANELTCLVVQVETRSAVERVAEIAAVEGVDGVLFGPGDLAADLGYLGDADHPEVIALMEAAIPKIRAAGKFAGMSSSNPARTQGWLAKGCNFISIGGDMQLLVTHARNASKTARAAA